MERLLEPQLIFRVLEQLPHLYICILIKEKQTTKENALNMLTPALKHHYVVWGYEVMM